jgi:hypothetical protein
LGDAWSLYDFDIEDVKLKQRHPSMSKYRLARNKSGMLMWMTPDTMRSTKNPKKRKREESDDEVSNVISEN